MAAINYIILVLFICVSVWVHLELSKKSISKEEALENLSKAEELANNTPAVDISNLPYICVPAEKLHLSDSPKRDGSFKIPVVREGDTPPIPNVTRKALLEHYKTLSKEEELNEQYNDLSYTLFELSAKKILNLSAYTNTEIKLLYGGPNYPFLAECDSNFTLLSRTLHSLGKYFTEVNRTDYAIDVLSYAVSVGTGIKATYNLLSDLYLETGRKKEFEALLDSMANLKFDEEDALIRDALTNY